MNMIPVRVEQEIAYRFPGTFASGPWAKELNRVTVRLSPATIGLQCFVEPPSQIYLSLVVQQPAPFLCTPDACAVLPRLVPTTLPNIESYATHPVNICGTTHLVMAEDARFKEDANYVLALALRTSSEKIKNVLQLSSEFGRYHRTA